MTTATNLTPEALADLAADDWEHGEDAATWPVVEYAGCPTHDPATCILCIARRGGRAS